MEPKASYSTQTCLSTTTRRGLRPRFSPDKENNGLTLMIQTEVAYQPRLGDNIYDPCLWPAFWLGGARLVPCCLRHISWLNVSCLFPTTDSELSAPTTTPISPCSTAHCEAAEDSQCYRLNQTLMIVRRLASEPTGIRRSEIDTQELKNNTNPTTLTRLCCIIISRVHAPWSNCERINHFEYLFWGTCVKHAPETVPPIHVSPLVAALYSSKVTRHEFRGRDNSQLQTNSAASCPL